ncbi:MAG: hypothetical protein WB347_19890, partial [Terriglobales bacterium]
MVAFHQVAVCPQAYVTKQVQCLLVDNRSNRGLVPARIAMTYENPQGQSAFASIDAIEIFHSDMQQGWSEP